jgi:rhodanese-related sulfurtransferase
VAQIAAKEAFDAGTAVFVDARGEAFFQESHIPGALSAGGPDFAGQIEGLSRDVWIIPYCS